MKAHAERSASWLYSGIWMVLVGLFRVPPEAPALPVASGQRHESFQPSQGYLRYLMFQFWLGMLVFGGMATALWIGATVALVAADQGVWAWALAPVALAVIIVPNMVAFIAIHLRYDTTWYVLTDRSMRLRHGIWIIRELTITFENVQNVTVQQGPVERYFGIANVVVDTAGGSVSADPKTPTLSHQGLIAGIDNAAEVRDLIMARVRASAGAGLGDERHPLPRAAGAVGGAGAPPGNLPAQMGWTAEHVAALRAIRDELRAMNPRAA